MEEIPESIKEQVKEWIISQAGAGKSPSDLRQQMSGQGYSPEIIEQFLRESYPVPGNRTGFLIKIKEFLKKFYSQGKEVNNKYLKIGLMAAGAVILLVILLAVFMSSSSAKICDTKECFVNYANQCKNVDMQFNESFGIMEYSANKCIFVKTFLVANPGDADEIRFAVEAKNMTCAYTGGNFDSNLINSLLTGTSACSGDLKDSLIAIKGLLSS